MTNSWKIKRGEGGNNKSPLPLIIRLLAGSDVSKFIVKSSIYIVQLTNFKGRIFYKPIIVFYFNHEISLRNSM